MLRHLTSSLLLLFTISASAFAASDSGLMALLPSDVQTVASMNVDSSRSSSFGQFMLRQMSANDKSFQDLIEQTGFDPRRDLQTFVVANLSSGKSQDRFVVLARGMFDQARISTNAAAKGMTSQTIGGVTVMLSSDGNRKMALAFPETGIAVLGDLASVEQVLKNRANPTTLSTGLQTQISAASANNDAWFASTVPASDLVANHVPPVGGSPQAAQAMQAVVQSNGGIRFGANIQLSFNALTRSDKDATSLTDVIRFVSSLIQMQRGNDPRAAVLAPAIESMQLRASGRQVFTSLIIPEADLEQLVASEPQASKRSR